MDKIQFNSEVRNIQILDVR